MRALIQADFGEAPPQDVMRRAFADWIAYRARCIPRRQRTVHISAEVRARLGDYPAIRQIQAELSIGLDMRPWLSRSLFKRRRDGRADLLFNDWQISHFHLSRVFARPDQIKGTRDLLFAYISADMAVLLDVLPHGQWACQELLRMMLRTEPHVLNQFELRGVLPGTEVITDELLFALRSKGVNPPIQIDGKVFMAPGMGIAASGHAMRHTRYADEFQFNIQRVKEAVASNTLPTDLRRLVAQNIAAPVRLGVLAPPDGTLHLVDKNRRLPLYGMRAVV